MNRKTLVTVFAGVLTALVLAQTSEAGETNKTDEAQRELPSPTPAWDFPGIEALSGETEPDPLVFLDGRRVKTREDWALRRLEIIRLAEHYIF